MEWWQIQELMWTVTGILVTLMVVSGVALRFAIKPFLKDMKELRSGKGEQRPPAQDLRLDRMEDQLEVLGSSVERLAEALEFDRQLKAGDEKP